MLNAITAAALVLVSGSAVADLVVRRDPPRGPDRQLTGVIALLVALVATAVAPAGWVYWPQ